MTDAWTGISADQHAEIDHTGLPGVGSGYRTQTHTISTDETFRNSFTYDDLGFSLVRIKATLLSFDPDGETPGTGSGQIAADLENVNYLDMDTGDPIPISIDWILDAPYAGDGSDFPLVTHRKAGTCFGSLYVTVNIIDGLSFEPYAGPNHPTATWEFEIKSWGAGV